MGDVTMIGGWLRVRSRGRRWSVAGALTALFLGSVAVAQQVADPGFKSVGRGAPLAVSLPSPKLPSFALAKPEELQRALQFLGAEIRSSERNSRCGKRDCQRPATADTVEPRIGDLLPRGSPAETERADHGE